MDGWVGGWVSGKTDRRAEQCPVICWMKKVGGRESARARRERREEASVSIACCWEKMGGWVGG